MAVRPVGGLVEAVSLASPANASVRSPRFNLRWKPDVADVDRARIESELGLVDAEPVARDVRGRTWSYRLQFPVQDRVRAVLQHPAVEDTAGIDARRLEIVE
jgi:hypothetical protein